MPRDISKHTKDRGKRDRYTDWGIRSCPALLIKFKFHASWLSSKRAFVETKRMAAFVGGVHSPQLPRGPRLRIQTSFGRTLPRLEQQFDARFGPATFGARQPGRTSAVGNRPQHSILGDHKQLVFVAVDGVESVDIAHIGRLAYDFARLPDVVVGEQWTMAARSSRAASESLPQRQASSFFITILFQPSSDADQQGRTTVVLSYSSTMSGPGRPAVSRSLRVTIGVPTAVIVAVIRVPQTRLRQSFRHRDLIGQARACDPSPPP